MSAGSATSCNPLSPLACSTGKKCAWLQEGPGRPLRVPFFRESTGSTITVCAGMCAPAKTDSTLPGNAKGDATQAAKLPTQAMPMVGNGVCVAGKKGSEPQQNCHYLWMYNNDGTQTIPSPYNDTLGVCFGYTATARGRACGTRCAEIDELRR